MPTPDSTPHEEEIFQVAAELPVHEREAYLDRACAGHPELRAAVKNLLVSIDDNAFMHRPSDRTTASGLEAEFARLKPEEAGDRIGAYKLLQQIGEGGFGVVWMAEQEKPVRRRVALKIIKLGMDTKEVIARFEQERQALALMDHPNIARVFDAGATATGRPFFVMELVKGVRVTEYCDTAQLPTADRLKLFIQVCHAVQHAHQKGVIHRDLKPSNILVTLHDGVPVPKVIDFGVAKATLSQRLTDLTLFTQFEQMIGTPLYMAPEQAELSGLDVDTRSDIYSLGVLLYELLTGRTPFDPEQLMSAGYDEMRRVIREEEPQKPSTFLGTMAMETKATVAKQRGAEEGKLISSIRGDLDWIVMKALEKDRNRRYETSSEFAKDIERHLSNEPVIARPPTPAYRFRRFVRRNKGIVSASVGIAAALLLGASLAVWQAVVARAESDRANIALGDLQATAPAFAEQARSLIGQERIDDAIEKLNYAIKLRPDGLEYRLAKADVLESQLRLPEAAAVYREALQLQKDHSRAAEHRILCEQLEAEQIAQGKLSRESLARLLAEMTAEKRAAAEMMKVGRMLGEENKLLLTYWLQRLKDLPIPPQQPLEQRLTMNDDGELALDLRETGVADLKSLQGIPLAELSLTGCEQVEDLSPLKGMPLRKLRVGKTAVHDLSPLRGMTGLTLLDLKGCKRIGNLSVLGSLTSLKSLDIGGTSVVELGILRGMSLTHLHLDGVRVSDLTPLKGMPLQQFTCHSMPATDFTPLVGAPLEVLVINGSQVKNLSFLRGMPLKALSLSGCNSVRGLEVLQSNNLLEVLWLPADLLTFPQAELKAVERLRDHPRLIQIAYSGIVGYVALTTATPKDVFWAAFDRDLVLREAVFGMAGPKASFEKREDNTWSVDFARLPVADLTPLKGLPISQLIINLTDVRDLTPLEGMKLRSLGMSGAPAVDLKPLKNLPLEVLAMKGCREEIDLAPLTEIKTLRELLLPPNPRNLDALRGLPNLERISFEELRDSGGIIAAQSAAEFWQSRRPGAIAGLKLAQEGKYAEAQKHLRPLVDAAKQVELARNVAPAQRSCSVDWIMLSTVIVGEGNPQTYQAYCQECLEFFAGTADPLTALRLLYICLLGPDSGVPPETLKALMKISDSGKLSWARREWSTAISALLDYRTKTGVTMVAPIAGKEYVVQRTVARLVTSLCYTHLEKLEAAKIYLELARQDIARHWPESSALGWHDWLAAHVLAAEAERAMNEAVRSAGTAETTKATEAALRAVEIRRQALGDDYSDVGRLLYQLGAEEEKSGDFPVAASAYRAALKVQENLENDNAIPARMETAKSLVRVLDRQEKYSEAESLARHRLNMARVSEKSKEIGEATVDMARMLRAAGKIEEADILLRDELPILRKILGNADPIVARIVHSLGHTAERKGDISEATALHREAVEIHRMSPSEAIPEMLDALSCLQKLLEKHARYPEAESVARDRLDFARSLKDPELEVGAFTDLGLYQALNRKYSEANASYRAAINLLEAHVPANHPRVISLTASLGRLLTEWAWDEHTAKPGEHRAAVTARATEAEEFLREVVKVRLDGPPADSGAVFEAQSRLGAAIMVAALTNHALSADARRTKLGEAEGLLLMAHPKLQADPKIGPRHARDSYTRLIRFYEASANPQKLEEWQMKLTEFDQAQAATAAEKSKAPEPGVVGQSVVQPEPAR